ncbi:hypothetical protein WJX81_003206 [Elliptochloris bilobata]|uniref:Vacuolar protein-sorting-associated protein 36 n=1 Tax=Elliptochloris bilobata TaxID=381761 RepID=A0AAW1SBI7_9CHLO
MGFPRSHAQHALAATGCSGVDAAIAWLLPRQGDPALDAPLQRHAPLEPPADWRGGAGTPAAAPSPAAVWTPGVAGILRREQQQAAAQEHALEEAFVDLRALMDKAAEMVSLAERYRMALATQAAGAAGGGGGEEPYMDAQLEEDLVAMGIASPVTKATAGALYHQELSRQLADFLRPRIERAGGMMPLPDVFCLFNRARGTELVSPDDLLAAVQTLPRIGAPLHFRRFESGVLVVQSDSHSDEQVCARLAELTGRSGLGAPLAASDVAAALAVPLAVAGEHLAAAEARGALCRDDGPEGLRFFRNFFADAECMLA